jgi:hypothetical protein
MPVQVQGPDGSTYQFPDGTDKNAAIAYFKKKGIGAAPSSTSTAPEKKPGFWDSYDKKVAPLVTPTQHDAEASGKAFLANPTAGTFLKETGKQVGTSLSNMGAGALSAILHPVNTVGGVLKTAYDASPAGGLINSVQGKDPIGDMAKDAIQHPLETAETMAGQTAAFGVGGKVIPKVAGAAKNAPKKFARFLTNTGEDTAKGVVDKTQAVNDAEAKAHQEKTQEGVQKLQDQRKADIGKHLETRDKAISDRKAAEDKVTAEKAKQGKIEPTQNKLQSAWSNLRAGVETAREKALKIGNEKYNTVNDKLSSEPSDREFIQNAFVNATEQLRGSHSDPTLLKDVERTLKTEGDISYSDLQGDYSRLGKELTKGTLDGDVFHAYDQLHEALGTEMQRIADSRGLGSQLTEARNYWRRMKQTFGKPFNPTDAATSTAEKSAPNVASAAEQANRIRLLGSFDPDLPGQFENVGNIRKGVDSLPKPKPERDIVQGAKAPSIPPRKPFLPKVQDQVGGFPDRPEAKTVGVGDITQANKESIAAKEKKARTGYSPLLTSISVFDAIRNAMEGNWAAVGRDVAARGAYEVGKQGYAALLRNPKVIDFLSKPTAEQIAQVPPGMRGANLQLILDEAKRKGIQIDPRIAVLASGPVSGAGPKQRIGDILKP